MKWPDLAVLAGVVVVFVGLHLLRRRRTNFSVLTLIALAVGIPIGLLARDHVAYIEPIGRIYINVLLAVVAPLIAVAIISSIASLGSIDRLRTIGLRSIGWLLLSNAVAVVLALGVGLASATGSGVDETIGGQQLSVLQNSVQDFTQVVVDFFPSNVVGDFGANHIIPVILISVTVAIAYLTLAERDAASVRPFRDGIEALKLVVFKAVGFVIGLTPYAIVALTATVVANSTNLGDKFWSLIGLLGLAWATCFVHTFAFNSVLLRVFADVSPTRFFRKIFPAQATAFSTQSSVGTLPVTTDVLTRRVGVHPEIAHFTAPLGTTIGMPGCAGIWPMLIAVWGINAYGIDYSVKDYVVLAILGTLVSIGTAGVPGTATVAAATVFAAAGLPLDFIAVTLPISTIADMARTATNVTAAAVSATIVARQTGLLDDEVFDADEATHQPTHLSTSA
ncbi:dicarboxylate/amino acid:cation symporter [Nocardioides marmoriginsengisoli]|uniref:Dicarboxylate/amino acid:cation symporter n=1 Tax=Nocardioides marmoriginsengisoli TaxID=661483 RepID=A0A3N0CHZ1_9ACTN|nr:dicarboxylate/amino acid:cation symporter [Nocardioides marmoriginsengisoli]RNL63088.1 dicarboxylate/amino acid:cation symporter [Nocardioides marmoriginsengisoli]